MNKKKQLISRLSSEIQPGTPIYPPRIWALRLLAVLLVYALAMPVVMGGLRPDLHLQSARPGFLLEIVLLVMLAISSAFAGVLTMYPDAYQKAGLLKLPYIIFLALIVFIGIQCFLPIDPRMVMPKPGTHGLECTLSIGAISIIPTAVIFMILRKGSSIQAYRSGSLAVLAATAIGCITLRLIEPNDLITHVISWHYIPTLLFSAVGAVLGKKTFKW